MGLYTEAMCYNGRQDNMIQYNQIQHITQNNIQYYRQLSILKLLLLLLSLTTDGFIRGGSVLQCKTGQYNTIQHITQNNTQYYRQLSILKLLLLLLLLSLLLLTADGFIRGGSVLKCKKYNTIQHTTSHKITHNTPDNSLYSNLR